MPDVDLLRRKVGVPIPCGLVIGVQQVAPVQQVSECQPIPVGDFVTPCMSNVLAAKKAPQQRLEFDYKAIQALSPGPGLPPCGSLCRKIIKVVIVALILAYLTYRTCVAGESGGCTP